MVKCVVEEKLEAELKWKCGDYLLESADEVFFERIFESEMRSVVVPGFGEVRCW